MNLFQIIGRKLLKCDRCINMIDVTGLHFLKDKRPAKILELVPFPKYGGESFVTLLTGSTTIGKQGADYIRSLFDSTHAKICFEIIDVKAGSQEFIRSVQRNRKAIYVDLEHDADAKQRILLLNSELDLYACVTKMASVPGFNYRHPNLNIVVIMQNNMGDYTKLQYEPVNGVVETLSIYTRSELKRYLTFVLNYAAQNDHKKITVAHQCSELPLSDGLFIDVIKDVHSSDEKYSHITLEFMIVKELVHQLVMAPNNFDLICTGDRYGTFVTAICSAVCGGPGLFSTREVGDTHTVFKPLQTKLSGTVETELIPYGVVNASIDLLESLGNHDSAQVMSEELYRTMVTQEIKTKPFGGMDVSEFVICNIVNNIKCKYAN